MSAKYPSVPNKRGFLISEGSEMISRTNLHRGGETRSKMSVWTWEVIVTTKYDV